MLKPYQNLNFTMLRFFSSSPKPNPISLHSQLTRHLRNQRLDDARLIFDQLGTENIYTYTNLIKGYLANNRLTDARQLFDKMPVKDIPVWNVMIKGYLDNGELENARETFDVMGERNVVTWTTIVGGYLRFGRVETAKGLWEEMEGFVDVAAWNAMVSGCFQNGRVDEAMELFGRMRERNVVTWTSVISGLDQNGRSGEAIALFRRMLRTGIQLTVETLSCVITACGNAVALEQGMQVHGRVVVSGFFPREYLSASLITFYSKCRQLEDFRKVFHEKVYNNVAVWTSLLSAYNLSSEHEDSFHVFRDMMARSVLPNQSTFTSVLNSCCETVAVDRGKAIHGLAIKLLLQTDTFVCNSLIVLYTKAGSMKDGATAFQDALGKNLISWNSMIVGCAQHGYMKSVLSLFAQMLRAKQEPDEITFTGLLYACSNPGMFLQGKSFYRYFSEKRSISMNLEHYACMVDIMGRSGELEEAENFIHKMPLKANTKIWMTLLGACKTHCNLDIGERAANQVFDLEPHCSAAYTLLSNLYASTRKWTDASRIRQEMEKRGSKKLRGRSWLMEQGTTHDFLSGDSSHPRILEIYQKFDGK
ncbi:hypothetical protein Droror1_Dr00005572 [Drosera rotundifolia]